MPDRSQIEDTINAGGGLLRLEPCWVPRSFMLPGRRLRLHSDDYYAFGGNRGGINERWFSSTTNADNGPGTPADEGLSYVRPPERQEVSAEGSDRESRGPADWRRRHAAGERLEPAQYNPTDNNYPYTFMGLEPGTTKDDVRRCLENWNKGDNGITYLSRAYRLERGTGWQINPGILHAPGSLLTYEPQVNSDVFAMFQPEVEGRIIGWDLLTKDVPPEKAHDLDYIIGMLDWEANTNSRFGESNRRFPKPVKPFAETEPEGYRERWVTYGTGWYSAKELTVLPKRSVTIKDGAAYGADAAKAGVRIENKSDVDPLVVLKHFGPGNPDAEGFRKK